MRKLTSEEKEFCNIMLDNSGNSEIPIQLFCTSKFKGLCVDIMVNNDNQTAIMFDPAVYGKGNLPAKEYWETVTTLVLAVNLMRLLENEGMISTIKFDDTPKTIVLGTMVRATDYLGGGFIDGHIIENLVYFATRTVVVSEEFRDFVRNDFRTEKQKIETWQFRIAVGALAISLISVIVTGIFSTLEYFKKDEGKGSVHVKLILPEGVKATKKIEKPASKVREPVTDSSGKRPANRSKN